MTIDERELKEQFEGYEVPPSPGVWDGIEQRLKRKRRGFLWFFLLGLLGIGAVSGYWGWQHWNDNEAQTNAVQQLDRKPDALHKPKKILASAIDSTPTFPLAKRKVEVKAEENNSGSKEQKGTTTGNSGNQVGPTGTSTNPKGAQSKATEENQPAWTSLEKMPLLKQQWLSKPVFRDIPIPDSPDYWVDSLADSLLKVDEDGNKGSKWKWGIQVMPQLTHWLVQSNALSQKQLSDIKGAESRGRGISGEANLYYQLGTNFQLQSGLWYAYDQADFQYESETTSQLAPQHPGDQSQGFDQVPSSTGPPEDSSEITTKVFKNKNQYFRFGIPLLLRYQVLESGQWQLFATSGFQVNYLHGLDQNFVGREGEVVYHIDDPANELIRALNVQYNFRLGLQYAINDEWSLAATPSFNASLFSGYTDQHFLESRPMQFGVGIGFIKDF